MRYHSLGEVPRKRHVQVRLAHTAGLRPEGDAVSGRRVLQFNADAEIAVCVPATEGEGFYRNGDGDEVIFVHEGSGDLADDLR